jgi:hypothetical protein
MRNLRVSLALLVASAALFVVGCGSKNNLEGKWKISAANMPAGGSATVDFQKPDKLEIDVDAPAAGAKVKIKITGTWTLSGDTLTIKGTDVVFEGIPEAMKPAMETQKKAMMEQMEKESSGKIKWETPDKFTSSKDDKGTTTFERVK